MCKIQAGYQGLAFHEFTAVLAKVWRVRFWMKHYKSATAKSTCLWSNSSIVSIFNLGRLSRAQLRSDVRTTDRYVDSKGRVRFKGNKHLKGTQTLPQLLTAVLFKYTFPSPCSPSTQLRTYTVHFARKVVQSAPMLLARETKDVLQVAYLNSYPLFPCLQSQMPSPSYPRLTVGKASRTCSARWTMVTICGMMLGFVLQFPT